MAETRHTLLGVRIDDVSLATALQLAEAWFRDGGFHQVVTPGPEFLLEAGDHPQFRDILNRADLSIPDGMGIKVGFLASGLFHRHRVAGVDYVDGLLRIAAHHHRSVFLFGAGPGVAEKAAVQMTRQHPGLIIAGIESGSRWPWTVLENRRVLERIHLAKPDILLVALGAPKQELWIDSHRAGLHDVTIAVGVGRTFDYYAGAIVRPPAWVRRIGMEWLYTFFTANSYRQQIGSNAKVRRQRVKKATWHFMEKILTQ